MVQRFVDRKPQTHNLPQPTNRARYKQSDCQPQGSLTQLAVQQQSTMTGQNKYLEEVALNNTKATTYYVAHCLTNLSPKKGEPDALLY